MTFNEVFSGLGWVGLQGRQTLERKGRMSEWFKGPNPTSSPSLEYGVTQGEGGFKAAVAGNLCKIGSRRGGLEG